MRIKKLIFILIVALLPLSFIGCETKDDNNLAKAQACLDALPDNGAAGAPGCMAIVAGMTTPESYVIRCSALFMIGGIKVSDVIAAVTNYNNFPPSTKAGKLMAALSQSTTTAAQNTYNACVESQVASLIYVATISLTGTLITAGNNGGVNGDPAGDPAAALAHCATPAVPTNCDDTAIGNAVSNMYSTYCLGSAATDNPVCSDVGSAVSAHSGDPAAIAQALYLLLQ